MNALVDTLTRAILRHRRMDSFFIEYLDFDYVAGLRNKYLMGRAMNDKEVLDGLCDGINRDIYDHNNI